MQTADFMIMSNLKQIYKKTSHNYSSFPLLVYFHKMILKYNYSVVIPAHNEEQFLPHLLDSLAAQAFRPTEAIVVDDNSTDRTFDIAKAFADKHSWIKVIRNVSEARNMPGSKVVAAFKKGLATLTKDYDFIVKLDADLVLPSNYFEKIASAFNDDPQIGMAGGFASIEKGGKWVLEKLTDDDHIRGAFKAYRKQCFDDIGGLKPAMGWDTVDELLARYHGWKVKTIPGLMVRHLKPTGAVYDKAARFKQGEAFHSLGYGFLITAIASAKLAVMKKKPVLFLDYIRGYFKASGKPLLVTPEQAEFIRHYRWKKMKQKLF